MNREQIQNLLTDTLQDKYEVLRWIGGGGMAEVYLARHRIHGALFAVKVLSLDLAQDERIVARFVQEARTAATLSGHPNIVPIFDIGAANGLYYLIMQYVDGEDLSKYLRRNKKLHPRDAAKIACQVADALNWASTRGVVHRDLKPSNLYLDNSGRVMVLDFGIAKATDVPSLLTAATERLGTTYYMSPEQIRGEPCDVRSDLYSLGVVFFELLAGRKPFDGDSYRAIELAHIEQPPPNLTQLDPAIPHELCEIINTLLQKSPAQRYQRAEDVIADLNRFGAGQSPLGIRPNTTTPTPDDQTIPSQGSPATPQNGSSSHKPAPPPSTPASPAPGQTPKSNIFVISAIVVLALLVAVAGYLYWQKTSPHNNTGAGAQQPQSTSSTAEALPKERTDKLGHRIVLVPAGKFIFGDDKDSLSPNGKKAVNLDNFYIDETEVSNGMYKEFCTATHHKTPDSPNFDSHTDLPVTNVSYDDAEAFAQWMGKRLPSEEEWEKAARGTDGRIYPWGDQPWPNPPVNLQNVMSFPDRKSPYGVYNMAGNVAEWTTEHFPAGPREKDDMKKALGTSHFSDDWKVIKGGYFGSRYPEEEWRCYMRRGFPRDTSVSDKIGFRCVTDPK